MQLRQKLLVTPATKLKLGDWSPDYDGDKKKENVDRIVQIRGRNPANHLWMYVNLLYNARNQRNMIRRKYPSEYELSPESLEKGMRWLTLRVKNIGNDSLHNMEINMHSTDSLQIFLRKSSDHIFRLTPEEERFLSFQVDAHGTTALYFSIRYFKEGGSFHWDSPWDT